MEQYIQSASWAFDVHNYTRVGFFRLDVVYRTDIDISRGMDNPGFLSSGGYNDRMFYGTAEAHRFGRRDSPRSKNICRRTRNCILNILSNTSFNQEESL